MFVIYPHAHVEGDDGDPDVLRCLSVDVRELQPGVVLLLPCLQGVSGGEGRGYRERRTITSLKNKKITSLLKSFKNAHSRNWVKDVGKLK